MVRWWVGGAGSWFIYYWFAYWQLKGSWLIICKQSKWCENKATPTGTNHHSQANYLTLDNNNNSNYFHLINDNNNYNYYYSRACTTTSRRILINDSNSEAKSLNLNNEKYL